MKLIMNSDTTKAVMQPVRQMNISPKVTAPENLRILTRLAPNMTGIATSKVNSVAVGLFIPNSKAAMMVAPDLDTPGKIAATS